MPWAGMRCPLQGNLQFLGRCPDWYALPRWGKWKRVAPLHEAVGDALGEGRLPCGSGGAGGVVWVGEVGAFDQHGGAVGAAGDGEVWAVAGAAIGGAGLGADGGADGVGQCGTGGADGGVIRRNAQLVGHGALGRQFLGVGDKRFHAPHEGRCGSEIKVNRDEGGRAQVVDHAGPVFKGDSDIRGARQGGAQPALAELAGGPHGRTQGNVFL